MGARRALSGALAATAAAATALVCAPSALAAITAPPATWAGGASGTNASLWSNGANWSGGSAPGSLPTIGLLSFPDLGASCDTSSPLNTCYTGVDNLGPATVNEMQIGGGEEYQLYPTNYDNPADSITLLGNGSSPNVGLTAAPTGSNLQLANFGIPIALGAAQQWDVSNNGIIYLNSITGNYPLTLNLNNGYVQANDVQTSSVDISGPGELQLDQFAGSPEKLPAVTISDNANGGTGALAVATQNANSGPITVTGTNNNLIVLTDHGPGETRLNVTGNVTLDSTTNVEFDIDGNNTTPGTDASQLTATGTVNFNGAQISLWQAQNAGTCTALTPGTTFTVLSAGALTGQIRVGGQLISQGGSATETFSSNTCTNLGKVIVNYGAKAITATIAGAPAPSGSGPQITGTAHAGDRLTVTNDGGWTGGPTPSYSYQWFACMAGKCSPISGATGSSYLLSNTDAGKTIEARVTASNIYGAASAFSNALGPVTSLTGTTTTPPAPTLLPALRMMIRSDLIHLRHPFGRRAIFLLLRHGMFRTRVRTASNGFLLDIWRTPVTIRRGKHVRHIKLVIARGWARPHARGSVLLSVHLTPIGRRLLHRDRFRLPVIATERFIAPGTGWITVVRRFRL